MHDNMEQQYMKKEGMNLKERIEGYIRGFEKTKENNEMI